MFIILPKLTSLVLYILNTVVRICYKYLIFSGNQSDQDFLHHKLICKTMPYTHLIREASCLNYSTLIPVLESAKLPSLSCVPDKPFSCSIALFKWSKVIAAFSANRLQDYKQIYKIFEWTYKWSGCERSLLHSIQYSANLLPSYHIDT